ncbi:MAG: hypothetical protein WBL95_08440 [Microcoleus sp.]
MPTEPYALCPMPHALCPVVPHLSEKGYTTSLSRCCLPHVDRAKLN